MCGTGLVVCYTVFNPLTPTVATWYSYKASCARLG